MREYRTRRRVEFSDTDMGGICHFSRFLVFMETAEHEFLNALGTSVHVEVGGQKIGWPRVAVSCEFHAPARFGETVEIHVRVARKGEKSLTFSHTLTRGDTLLAKGQMRSVCCILNDPSGVKAIPIPAEIAERIEEAGE
jgi:YbgC/YbaW family acyl-CoA thioester hydrolase